MTQRETRYGLNIPNDKSVEELIELTKEKPPACWNAYTALGNNTSDKSIYALSILLTNSDWTHVRSAIEAIGNNVKGIQLTDKLIGFLDHSNKFIVSATIKALSKLRSTKAHDKIKSLTNFENVEIRQVAIEGLSNIWLNSDFGLLLDIYKHTKNETIRKSIGFVLAEHVDKNNWRTFFDNYHKDSIARHREWSLHFACEFSNDKTLIEPFLKDKDGHIRKRAQKFMETIKSRLH